MELNNLYPTDPRHVCTNFCDQIICRQAQDFEKSQEYFYVFFDDDRVVHLAEGFDEAQTYCRSLGDRLYSIKIEVLTSKVEFVRSYSFMPTHEVHEPVL